MTQVATFRQRHAHQALPWGKQRRVDGKISRTSTESLHVDRPFVLVQTVGLQGALLGEQLDLVDEFVTSVVAGHWVALEVLVRQTRALHLQGVAGGEILRCDKFDASVLTLLLLQEQISDFWVPVLKGLFIRQRELATVFAYDGHRARRT